MKKVYTQVDGAYVFPRSRDLRSLKPDSCAVRIVGEKPCVIPLQDLSGKEVENGDRHGYSSVWGYHDDKNDPYILINGAKKKAKFCDLCKDRLSGITGNCLNKSIKPSGCSFQPVEDLKPFAINLSGWRKLRPVDVNERTPFLKPYLSGVAFDPKLIKQNQKIRIIARHLPEYQERKLEKYCSRCIFQGTCYLHSHKVAEHCMVTEEETIKKCLGEIMRRFGSVHDYLGMLAYSGGRLMYKPEGYIQESEWRVAQPFDKKQYEIAKSFQGCNDLKVSRKLVEGSVTPVSIPKSNRERIAALAWYYLDRYHFHRLWISLRPEGIEATHQVYGHNRFFRAEVFTSFNEIHFFFTR
ncbi:MAG TPA: hypothetical protein PKV84_01590 [Candidatus Omnitrophota bacterium]|nr:hypothetical protein [Candidatus Omnitrophota bacterium]